MIYSVLCAFMGLWLACTLLFFSKIKREYWSTFYSWESGRQNSMAYFLDNANDVARKQIFRRSQDLWSDIRDDVKSWTLKNWNAWVENPPDWFSDAFKESVPDDMIPKSALDELNKKAGGVRRRSSAGFVVS
jgi:hypothetical protein